MTVVVVKEFAQMGLSEGGFKYLSSLFGTGHDFTPYSTLLSNEGMMQR